MLDLLMAARHVRAFHGRLLIQGQATCEIVLSVVQHQKETLELSVIFSLT